MNVGHGGDEGVDDGDPGGLQLGTMVGAPVVQHAAGAHVGGGEAATHLGDPINNPLAIASLQQASRVNGATICNAAVLVDDRVWLHTADGQTLMK